MTGSRVLILGNMLSSVTGTRGVGEDLAYRLGLHAWSTVTASRYPNRVMKLIDMLWTIWRHRKHMDVAVVEVYSGAAFIWAECSLALLRLLSIPVIVVLHGGKLPEFSRRWPRRVRKLLTNADIVCTPSNYLRDSFQSTREDIVLLVNATDLAAYPYRHRPDPLPRLAWLRAFHAIYNPSMAAKTLALLVDEFPELELCMFGPDKQDASLRTMQKFAEEAGVLSRIEVPGAIPKLQVPERLSAYDIFLNTTTAESFGVSVMEAAALGMCIVTTNVGELPYIWTHEHDALLVPPDDAEAMAAAIRRILTEPGLAEKLSRNARLKAEQFDWQIVLPQWEALLRKAMQ